MDGKDQKVSFFTLTNDDKWVPVNVVPANASNASDQSLVLSNTPGENKWVPISENIERRNGQKGKKE